jgi:hypothetical protein
MNNQVLQPLKVCALACCLYVMSAYKTKAQTISVSPGVFEVGVNLGAYAYLGDLGGNRGVGTYFIKDYNIPFSKLYKGVFVTYYPKEYLGVKFQLNQGMLEGADAAAKDNGGAERFRRYRNLSFRTNIWEASLNAEFYPMALSKNYEAEYDKFRPFATLGFGLFRFNPQAPINTGSGLQWVDLKPLRTEGQGILPGKKEYSLVSPLVNLGLGFKYMLSDKWFVGLEAVHRFTFTDYLDDVSTVYVNPAIYAGSPLTATQQANALILNNRAISFSDPAFRAPGAQRGNAQNKDSYFSYHLKVGLRLIKDERKQALRRLRCFQN